MTSPLLSTFDAGILPEPSTLPKRPKTQAQLEELAEREAWRCHACGVLHGGAGTVELSCMREALREARKAAELTRAERGELANLREKCDRLDREIANRTLQSRGR